MAQFCGNCGAPLKDGAQFCSSCGAKVPGAGQASGGFAGNGGSAGFSGGAGGGHRGGSSTAGIKKYLPIIGIAAAVIVVAIILISIFAGGGYKKPVKQIEKALNKEDFDLYEEAFVEDFAGDEDSFEMIFDYLKDPEFKIEIEDVEKIKKDDIKDELEEETSLSSRDIKKVKQAYIVDVNMEVEYGKKSDRDSDDEDFSIYVVKMDGKWLIAGGFYL